jgi:hypothetical protein
MNRLFTSPFAEATFDTVIYFRFLPNSGGKL